MPSETKCSNAAGRRVDVIQELESSDSPEAAGCGGIESFRSAFSSATYQLFISEQGASEAATWE